MRLYLLASALMASAFAAPQKPAPDPRISSIYPFGVEIGKTVRVIVRGQNLSGARAIDVTGAGLEGRVTGVEIEAANATTSKSGGPAELVELEIHCAVGIRPGVRRLRLLTANGITNEISLPVFDSPVVSESEATDPIASFPLAITGRILQRGEVDAFWFQAAAGQTLTFQGTAGHDSLDLSLGIFEPAPSWFDPKHMEQLAYNDEPLSFPGLSSDPQITYTFSKAGKYCLRVQSSTGQGSEDSVYELRITPGAEPVPALRPKPKSNVWEERQFTRSLAEDWNQQLARRGAAEALMPPVERYRAVTLASRDATPTMALPAMLEGTIRRHAEGHAEGPAEAHRIKLRIDKPENIAIEIETPDATMPRFNPVVLLFEPGGAEIATNVYTKRNNNGLYMMKMIQSKLALALQAPGSYEMEIRDITTDRAGDNFRYRILVRRQIPHVGKLDVREDRINLRRGATRDVTISVEREEGFNGLIAFSVEGLPSGVTTVAAAPAAAEKPPLPNGGRLERYVPVIQSCSLVFIASADAPTSAAPSTIKIVARPMLNGKMGDPIVVKELPLMVLAESAT